MALKISTPGVYIEEVPTFPPSVAEVESAIPAFIGYTEMAKLMETDTEDTLLNIPTKISNLQDYVKHFGMALPMEQYSGDPPGEGQPETRTQNLSIKVNEKNESGQLLSLDIIIDHTRGPKDNFILYNSLRLYFANGGGPCYVVSVGNYEKPHNTEDLIKGINSVENYDEPTLLLCPEAVFSNKHGDVVTEVINQCIKPELRDRFAIVDVKMEINAENAIKPVTDFRQLSLDHTSRRYAAAYYPYLETSYGLNYDLDKIKVTEFTVNGKNDDSNPSYFGDAAKNSKKSLKDITGSELHNRIKEEYEKKHINLPPSPAIAGIYAKTDSTRGVWKAPANVVLVNVIRPVLNISQSQQENMNIDPTAGKSVNVIRQFSGIGNVVWGARTLDGNDNEWRYVNVRRFFITVEESIKKSVNWAVFEPNTALTWVKVKGMIENYLFQKWRDGALAGSKPEEAYFVKVGLNQTMTAQDVLEGKMIVEVGMAVARPAEFIIIKFSHLLQSS